MICGLNRMITFIVLVSWNNIRLLKVTITIYTYRTISPGSHGHCLTIPTSAHFKPRDFAETSVLWRSRCLKRYSSSLPIFYFIHVYCIFFGCKSSKPSFTYITMITKANYTILVIHKAANKPLPIIYVVSSVHCSKSIPASF